MATSGLIRWLTGTTSIIYALTLATSATPIFGLAILALLPRSMTTFTFWRVEIGQNQLRPMENIEAKESSLPLQIAANPPLVFLHGTSDFSEDWSAVIDHLSETRLVIRHDYMNSKGEDGSGHPKTIAEAASRVLRDSGEKVQGPFDLVGYSLGASVAAFIAAEYPEMVRSLVLVSGFAYGGDVRMKLQFSLWLDLARTNRTA